VIAMGPHVSFIRVLGPLMGNYFDYACFDENHATASGQISIAEFHDIYHYTNLNPNTRIYALLGHPVAHSLGHQLHNQYFLDHEKSSVYVKIDIEQPDLKDFLKLAHTLPFDGFSVTMPLKQVTGQLVNNPCEDAINTLLRDKKDWQGFNTDGVGALQALNLTKPSKILILGFGGAARGIGYALEGAGHQVTYVYRSQQDNQDWGNDSNFDGFISTLPPTAWENIHPIFKKVMSFLRPDIWVMDINYNQASFFEDFAAKKGCLIISGYQMFLEQAKLQWKYWFGVR
jgi:3-dehydroquinate dehydratase/shikimate dehydrogenase